MNLKTLAPLQHFFSGLFWVGALLCCTPLIVGAAEGTAWVTADKLNQLVPKDALPAGSEVSVDINTADARLGGRGCPTPLFGNSRRSKLWGRTFLEVQCVGGDTAPFFIAADVKVTAPVWVAKELIAAGEAIGPNRAELKKMDLTQLGGSWVTDLSNLDNKTAIRAIYAGTPLKPAMLKGRALIKRGEQVKIVIVGPGFNIAGAGVSLEDAEQGALLKVKTDKGKVLSGVAKDELLVEVTL